MNGRRYLARLLVLVTAAMLVLADSGTSTRVADLNRQTPSAGGRYPYRQKSAYVLQELDLKPGDVVVDIGAGDGWWARKMADEVGPAGAIYAAEVEPQKVDKMKNQFADVPQIKPYLCPLDCTGLAEGSCDLAFLSKTYHHLSNHVDYLRHLRKVLKPTGRVSLNNILGLLLEAAENMPGVQAC